MSGISNFTIEKIINEIDDDLKTNFVGVFPIKSYLSFLKICRLSQRKKSPISFYDTEHR